MSGARWLSWTLGLGAVVAPFAVNAADPRKPTCEQLLVSRILRFTRYNVYQNPAALDLLAQEVLSADLEDRAPFDSDIVIKFLSIMHIDTGNDASRLWAKAAMFEYTFAHARSPHVRLQSLLGMDQYLSLDVRLEDAMQDEAEVEHGTRMNSDEFVFYNAEYPIDPAALLRNLHAHIAQIARDHFRAAGLFPDSFQNATFLEALFMYNSEIDLTSARVEKYFGPYLKHQFYRMRERYAYTKDNHGRRSPKSDFYTPISPASAVHGDVETFLAELLVLPEHQEIFAFLEHLHHIETFLVPHDFQYIVERLFDSGYRWAALQVAYEFEAPADFELQQKLLKHILSLWGLTPGVEPLVTPPEPHLRIALSESVFMLYMRLAPLDEAGRILRRLQSEYEFTEWPEVFHEAVLLLADRRAVTAGE